MSGDELYDDDVTSGLLIEPKGIPESETQAEKEERWAIARRQQAAYRATLEAQNIRQNRIDEGLCVLEDGQCVTHHVADSMSHHFDVHPDANND